MKKILIAEDEEILLDILKDRFKDDGWDVHTAVNGEEAISLINKGKFDLVLLDLLMPKKDGYEVLEAVQNNPELKELPIIVLSNLGVDSDIKRAMEMGAKDYFIKTKHEITEIIEKARVYGAGKN